MLTAQALLGIVAFVALALPLSSGIRRIRWKLVSIAILLQFAICALLLKVPVLADGLKEINGAVIALTRSQC